MGIGIIVAIFAIVISIIVFVVFRHMNERYSRQKMNHLIETEEKTILMRHEDEDKTVLMSSDEDEPTLLGRTIILRSEAENKEFTFVCIKEVVIGRKSVCDIQLKEDKTISGIHCTISIEEDGSLMLMDNGSSNGTFLNQKRITMKTPIFSEDILEIGRSRFVVQVS